MSFVNYELWTHGNSMQVEYPDRLSSIQRAGFFTQVEGKPGTANWFHFAIPTPATLGNEELKIAEVFIRFRTGSPDAYVKSVYLYDAENRIAEFNDLNLAPEDFTTERFDPALLKLNYGLGVSINVVFGVESMSHKMEFSSAGSIFTMQIENNTEQLKVQGKKTGKTKTKKKSRS